MCRGVRGHHCGNGGQTGKQSSNSRHRVLFAHVACVSELARNGKDGAFWRRQRGFPAARRKINANGTPCYCRNGGHHRFDTKEELKALYPDPNVYIRGVVETMMKNLAAGTFITASETDANIAASEMEA